MTRVGRNDRSRGHRRAHLDLCVGKFHIVEDAKHNLEEFDPPVLSESLAVRLHNLKHHGQRSRTAPKSEPPAVVVAERINVYLVLTSSLHRLMMHESSKRMGNHPFTQMRSSSETLIRSSPACSRKIYNSMHVHFHEIPASPLAHLWLFSDVFCTLSNQSYCLHGRIRKRNIACEF